MNLITDTADIGNVLLVVVLVIPYVINWIIWFTSNWIRIPFFCLKLHKDGLRGGACIIFISHLGIGSSTSTSWRTGLELAVQPTRIESLEYVMILLYLRLYHKGTTFTWNIWKALCIANAWISVGFFYLEILLNKKRLFIKSDCLIKVTV
jgi:hypothetical protein